MSRLICGGNLISGYAHARDLLYVSELLTNYFTPEKIFKTLTLCEEKGINTLVMSVQGGPNDAKTLDILHRYWNKQNGKIQWLAQCSCKSFDIETSLNLAVDNGAVGIFVQGGVGDRWTFHKRVDLLAKAVDFIKENGLIAGIAGHSLNVVRECEKAGVPVDFYVKTFHHDRYWSATPRENRVDFNVDINYSPDHGKDHDNIWCINPEETQAFMETVTKPWIAYKVMAAGAIHPKDAFKFAFKNGADFILAGMFDFQIVQDVVFARNALQAAQKRGRVWYG